MRELIGKRIRYSIPVYRQPKHPQAGEGTVTEAQEDWVQVDGHKNVHKEHITHIESGNAKDGWAKIK